MGIGDELAQGGTTAMRAMAIKAMQILYDILKSLVKLLGKGIIISGKEITKARQMNIKGEISIGQLNKLLERSARGKQLMTVPRDQLDNLKSESKKLGIPFAVIHSGADNTVQICMSDRDAGAFSDICRNVAMRNISQNPEKFFHDSDSRGVDSNVAKQVYARADIPQMAFRKPDGTTITQVDKAHEKAYLKAKQDMVIPLSREINAISITAVDNDFVKAVRNRTTFAEMDRQEAYGLNHQLADKPGLDVNFIARGDNVIVTYPLDKEAEIKAMRENFTKSRTLADKVNIVFNEKDNAVTFNSGTNAFEIPVMPEKDFRAELDKHLQDTSSADNELFKSMLMRDVHKTLTNTPEAEKAADIFNYDIFQNHMEVTEVPNTEHFMDSLTVARDVLNNNAERFGGELSDDGGICVYDKVQNEFRVISPKTKEDIAETLENSFRYSDIKAAIVADKVRGMAADITEPANELERIEAKNPLLSNCMVGKFDEGYSLFNTIGTETIGYVIANNAVPRSEIEKALSDTLKIDDPTARAELMSKLDEKGILPTPNITELDGKERGKFKVRQTTKEFCSVEMANGETVLIDKSKASPETVAEKFALDRNADKGLIKSLTRAIKADGAKGKTPLTSAIDSAISKANDTKKPKTPEINTHSNEAR